MRSLQNLGAFPTEFGCVPYRIWVRSLQDLGAFPTDKIRSKPMKKRTDQSYENAKELGKTGEEYCCIQLENAGYEIIQKNYHSPYGEIDIIAKEGQFLVFIEVKTRSKSSMDHTMSDITYSKQKKITKTAMYFLVNYTNPEILEYRFDVMILIKKDNTIEINHLKNAFEPAEVGDFFA